MEVRKPVRLSLARQVLDEMEKQLRHGVWKVGEKIPPEPELVRNFGVSRNTIREAVQSLIHAGVLEARPGDGTYVRASDRFAVALDSRLRASELTKILEARLALEKEIARLAAQHRSSADLTRLEQLLERRNHCGNDGAAADLEFHTAVAAATHNPILAELYDSIARHLRAVMQAWLAENPCNSEEIAAHNRLLEAIRNADPAAAEEATCRIVAFDQSVLST